MDWKESFPKEYRCYETANGILYNADCLELLPCIPQESIDLILTDPPYGVGSNERNGINYKDEFYNVDEVSSFLYGSLKDNSRAYVFTAQKTFIDVAKWFENNGFYLHQTLIWYKKNLAGGTKKRTYDFTSTYEQILNFHKGKPHLLKKDHLSDVLEFPQPQSNYTLDKRYHIHQKPLKLIEYLIYVSTNENDIVFDPFAGSGTTAAAAERLGRRWVAIEIQPEYCQIAKERIRRFASIKPLIGFGC
ncbi:DNA-methyltransferase [Hippea maritima]|uniref:Methyltransferase n=1 Tax=Hippea maritima (strain ATCC 700847 / DSM 10411 / MH2) TaxID=760142 RepID=F2LV18_HIPMA|nr:site-specific DNA-methyltransferase [Hippea maritima]AEA33602.1 DNA methylase N-4/N-6 domain protein [Hippea maritima DSM 10411]